MKSLLVYRHRLVRAGVRLLLERDGVEVVAEAGRLADAVQQARRHTPHLIVLQADLPDGDGIAAISRLRTEAPDSRILVVGDERIHRARLALQSGADGYLLDSDTPATFMAAIDDIANGGRYLAPTLAAQLVHAELHERSQPLSAREGEVLRLLARGHTNQQLAAMLVISVRTVEAHRQNIMHKLQLTSRTELVTYALHAGMLNPTPT